MKGFNLIILIDGSKTYSSSRHKTNVLDLSIVNPSLAAISNWESTSHLLGSDHAVINILIESIALRYETIRPSFRTFRVDWDEFSKNLCEADFTSSSSGTNAVSNYNRVHEAIQSSVLDSGGKIVTKSNYSFYKDR